MAILNKELQPGPDQELVIERVFDAPQSLVFKAWTDPKMYAKWSGPKGFTIIGDYAHVRPGGRYRACLCAPDGIEHWVRGIYQEVLEPERLVFTHAWEDAQGRPGPSTIVTVIFAPLGNQTRMRFHQGPFASHAARDGHGFGWSESFDRLAEILKAEVITP